jgi:hypothetical protein
MRPPWNRQLIGIHTIRMVRGGPTDRQVAYHDYRRDGRALAQAIVDTIRDPPLVLDIADEEKSRMMPGADCSMVVQTMNGIIK